MVREAQGVSVTPTSAREVAHEVIQRVFEDGAYADRAFRSAAERAGLDQRERSFAMQLAYGTVQRVRPIDRAIEELGRRPLRKLDPPVRAALRLGAYQIAYLRSVPVHAAVNETVELVRRAGLERAVAFTNAIMRRLSAGLTELLEGLPERTPAEAALRHSYPDWIAELWWRELGAEETLALLRAQNEPAETAMRVNRRKVRAPDDLLAVGAGHARPYGPDEIRPPHRPVGRRDPDLLDALVVERVPPEWIEQGLAWPQSRGSQLAGLAVGASSGERVLDVCAAPGGKATQLAGDVVAVELHEGRARELQETVTRLGATNVQVLRADGLALPSGLSGFDRALVDAPCSGLGTLASHPDLRWRAEPLPELQLALIRAAAERVRPGGSITYAVCTINAAENEEVVDALGLEADDLGAVWPRFRHPTRPKFLLTLPNRHGTSGFFVARLRRP